ncbi:hypothetical protein D3C86_1671160 [compost metagenome]
MFFPEEAGNIREHIECSTRFIRLHARHFVECIQYQSTSVLECFHHVFQNRRIGIYRCNRCTLCNGTRSGSKLSLDLIACICNFFRCTDITNSPSGHCPGLGNSVHGNHLFTNIFKLRHGMIVSHEVNVFVDLI